MKRLVCVVMIVCCLLPAQDDDKKETPTGFIRFTHKIEPGGLFPNKESKGEVYFIDEVQAGRFTVLVLRNKNGVPIGITK